MWQWLIQSIHAHPTAWAMGAYFVASNAISAMPKPVNGGFYGWLYDFSHLMAGNITQVVKNRFPQANTENK